MYELQPKRPPKSKARETSSRVPPNPFQRGMKIGLLTFAVLALLATASLLIAYAAIAGTLPGPTELAERAKNSFQSTRIFDRDGELLFEAFNPNDPAAGRRTRVELARISPYLRTATIATEDANFYEHRGVDPVALLRAFYYAFREGDIVSGASTIPQQLVKIMLLSPERSLTRKIKEAILASEVSRQYNKNEILEFYLNEIFYGNLAYGADAAAKTYYNKNVTDLTLGEAALLAGLPQAPAYYDPYNHPDRAKKRQGVVLGLMVKSDFISQKEADAAWLEQLSFVPLQFDMHAPHFTIFVRQQLEALVGPEALYNSGLNVTTSLDSQLQEAAQRIVQEQVAQLGDRNVSNGALVAMRPDTGEILALVGSADFDNVEIDGQVNMALAPRQPGSTMKPLVYLATFEQPNRAATERWTPGTLVADILQEFPDGVNPPYVPRNYDDKEMGLVTVRTALATSRNIPAVRALQTVEMQPFLQTVPRLGITTLTQPNYGLSLSLGAGEIPLVEMTGAFAVLANSGKRMPPLTILKIVTNDGRVYCEAGTSASCQPNSGNGEQVVSPVDAFLLTDILSDNEARTPVFGPNSMLRLERPAAVKTGTTNDFRDVLTIGYTPQLVTGVWVGNADNSPMINISGVSGAAPIWNQFMQLALANETAMEFTPPPGVRQFEVCADTGTQPSEACPEKRVYWFAEDRPPLPPEKDLWQMVKIDKLSGKLATDLTPEEAIEKKPFKVYPEQYRRWAEEHGIAQPPTENSDLFTTPPNVLIRQPVEGEIVNGVVTVVGSAAVDAFVSYELQYGESHDPGAFSAPLRGPHDTSIIEGVLGEWDTTGLSEGPYTLRLVVRNQAGTEFEQRVRLFIGASEPTATLEETPTWTPEVTLEPLPTDTLPPLETPTASPTDTPIPEVTVEPPTPEATVAPIDTPVTEVTVEPPTVESPTSEATAAAAVAPAATSEVVATAVVTETDVITETEVISSTAP